MKRIAMDGTDDEREKKKKKKIEIALEAVRCVSLLQLPIDLVFELCTRLPIKDLFQCMYVSKAWRSIILHHPGFSDAYRSRRNSSVLVVSLCITSTKGKRRSFYQSSTLGDDEFVNTLNVRMPIYIYSGVTQVINGLVCLYTRGHVSLCNTWTGEVMRLPDPHPVQGGVYFLGFDPVSSVYKLLRMFGGQIDILTLGPNSDWRKLPNSYKLPYTDSPMYSDHLSEGCFSVNGVLYWKSGWKKLVIISFNLSEEKFSFISLPDGLSSLLSLWSFAQFRGRLSLFLHLYPAMSILYMLDYNEGGYVWTMHKTMLPSGLQTTARGKRAVPVGSLPNGEILLAGADFGSSSKLVYSYNYEENKFKRLVLRKLPHSINLRIPYGFAISSMEPNFRTLDSLIRGGIYIK